MESQEYSGPILNKKQRFLKTLLLYGQLVGNEVTGHQEEYANKLKIRKIGNMYAI